MGRNIRNIEYSKVLLLKDQVMYGEGQVVSKTIAQNNRHSLTLFAFDKDEEISTHKSEGDALVLVLEGVAEVTIDKEKYILCENEAIVMPSNAPHAVYAKEKLKMLLTVSFPED